MKFITGFCVRMNYEVIRVSPAGLGTGVGVLLVCWLGLLADGSDSCCSFLEGSAFANWCVLDCDYFWDGNCSAVIANVFCC